MPNVFSQVKVDRNVYLDTWSDFQELLETMHNEAQASARDFSRMEGSGDVPSPEEFSKMMREVAGVMGNCRAGLEMIGKKYQGKVFFRKGE